MNTERVAIQSLNPGDRFMFPESAALHIVRSVKVEGQWVRLTYRAKFSGTEDVYTTTRLSTVDRLT